MNKKKQTKNMLMDMTIEEQLLKIQEIAAELENGSLGLEDRNKPLDVDKALAKYEEGVRLVRGCAGQIDQVQKRITVIETETEDEL